MTTIPLTRAEWFVPGTPAPQGSKKLVGPWRMIESSAAVGPWRQAVAWTCRTRPADTFTGPVMVELAFYLRRPKSAPKRVTWPATRPDLDKIIRASLDALGEAGVFLDDGQVVRLVAAKHYALGATGARILVESADAAEVRTP